MGAIKIAVAKVKNNPAGSIIGAAIVPLAAWKFGKVKNKWALTGLAIVGLLAGAQINSAIRAKASEPKKADIKK